MLYVCAHTESLGHVFLCMDLSLSVALAEFTSTILQL